MNVKIIVWLILLVMCSVSQIHAKIKNDTTVFVQPDVNRILRNPLSGWVIYASMGKDASEFWNEYDHMYVPDLKKEIRLSDYAHTLYIRASWTDFNPKDGEYGWITNSNLKAYIDGAYKRNMRLAFRIVVDSRDKSFEYTPEFVKDAGAKGFISRGKWSPYPDDPIFQKYYTKFVKALGKEFNDPQKLEFIDGFGLGKWGEYHTLLYSTGDENPKKAVFDWVTNLYSNTFDKVPVIINYHRWIGTGKDWVDDEHYDVDSESMLEEAIAKGYSLRHDAFGMTTYYGSWERKFAEKYRYVRPIIMEGGWIVKAHHSFWIDPRGYKNPKEVRQGEYDDSKEAHVNMMDLRFGGETSSWINDAFDLVQQFLREGGYRLYPSSVSLPQKVGSDRNVEIEHVWQNVGWGYCPTNIPQWNQKYKVAFALLDLKDNVKYSFVDNSTDLSKWIKELPVKYEFTPDLSKVKKGNYVWAVGLIDKTNDNKIGLELSVDEELLVNGWLKLIDVEFK